VTPVISADDIMNIATVQGWKMASKNLGFLGFKKPQKFKIIFFIIVLYFLRIICLQIV